MSNGMGALVAGAAVIAAGFAGYEYISHQNASAGTGPTSAPAPTGFQPPDNLLSMMQAAWWANGSTNQQGPWVTAMNNIVPSAGGNAWSYVFYQWASVYDQSHAWPSNDQLKGWLKYAVDNGLGQMDQYQGNR